VSTLAALRTLRAQLADSPEHADGVAALSTLLDAVDARNEAAARYDEGEAKMRSTRLSTLDSSLMQTPLDRYQESLKCYRAGQVLVDTESALAAILRGKR